MTYFTLTALHWGSAQNQLNHKGFILYFLLIHLALVVSRNTRLFLTVLTITPAMPGASVAVSVFGSGSNPEPNSYSYFELQYCKPASTVLEHNLNDH